MRKNTGKFQGSRNGKPHKKTPEGHENSGTGPANRKKDRDFPGKSIKTEAIICENYL